MNRLRRLLAASAMVSVLCGSTRSHPPASAAPPAHTPLTPAEYRRPEAQTFLTWPEWYLVYSPTEYAQHVAKKDPSEFPFIGHLRQFAQCYRAAWESTRGRYPFNADYHLMCSIIGLSTAAEYSVRATYEGIVGRLSALLAFHGPSAEECYGAQVAQRYADLLNTEAWYEFDFFAALRGLWTQTPWVGPDLVRKVERRYALSTEYLLKGAYAWAMRRAARASYQPEATTTAIVVRGLPTPLPPDLTSLKVLQQTGESSTLALAPRYAGFTPVADALARNGCTFVEIAGNRGLISLSVLAPRYSITPSTYPNLEVLLCQPLTTQPSQERAFLSVQVSELSATLEQIRRSSVQLEHIYDY